MGLNMYDWITVILGLLQVFAGLGQTIACNKSVQYNQTQQHNKKEVRYIRRERR